MTSTPFIDATLTTPSPLTSEHLSTSTRVAVPAADRWRQSYTRRLWLSDLLVLVWVVFGVQIAWFGFGSAQLSMREDSRITDVSYWEFSVALIVAWMWMLSLVDSRDHRVVGTGTAEYVRVARASYLLFGGIAIVAFLLHVDVARGFLLLGLPLGVLVLFFERWLWRKWLHVMRSRGQYSARVLLVGSRDSVAQIARELRRSPESGYKVVGACVPSIGDSGLLDGSDIPVVGDLNTIDRALAATDADTVVVTSTDDLPPTKVKQLSWALEAGRQHLVLAPGIIDIAGPRLHSRPVAGLPLIHVETPKYTRGQRVVKRTADLVGGVVGVVLASPLLIFLAIAVRLSGPGPVLFLQTRVGRRGTEFTMLKFRSMVVDAEDQLEQLARGSRDAGNEVLFKMKNDPRVTPIGRFMRKYSLDELPQLFNVILGSMSLVGPRPSLPREVAQYADHVHRRFIVKPGITGLWQVSGRSTLTWEESVRLDLSYVENWSLVGDLGILTRTLRAALLPGETTY